MELDTRSLQGAQQLVQTTCLMFQIFLQFCNIALQVSLGFLLGFCGIKGPLDFLVYIILYLLTRLQPADPSAKTSATKNAVAMLLAAGFYDTLRADMTYKCQKCLRVARHQAALNSLADECLTTCSPLLQTLKYLWKLLLLDISA